MVAPVAGKVTALPGGREHASRGAGERERDLPAEPTTCAGHDGDMT